MHNKVCHISTVHSYFDDRIFQKECVSLSQNGYNVYYIVTHDKSEIIDGVNIIPLNENKSRIYRFFIKRWSALNSALKLNADLYHFHDPEFVFMGLILRLAGKKVIYDVHEDVPLQILGKTWVGNEKLRKIVASVFNKWEKFCAKQFNGVISVTDEIVDKFKKNKNAILLRNFPVLSEIDNAVPADIKTDGFTIIYAGGIMETRGIKEIIEAVGILDGKVNLLLLGSWDDNDFRSKCMELNGWSYTREIGQVKPSEVYSYMKSSDAGMCTLYPIKNYLESLPVKAFEYIACGIPMIMSNFPFWMNEFSGFAKFVDPYDSVHIAKNISLMIEEKSKGKLSETIKIDKRKYCWETERKKLFELYKKILEEAK